MKLHEVADSRPLIWRLVAQQLGKGKKVLYHAHMSNSSAYLIGVIMNVFDDYASLRKPGSKMLTNIPFSEHDDTDLTLRPSNDPTVADYTVVDTE
jgi:hypothetical protein